MGKNLELAIMAALLQASGMLDGMKGMILAHRNNYNPAFSGKNIRKISNLKYANPGKKSHIFYRKF